MQKGFAPILILVGILVLIGVVGGAYYLIKNQTNKTVSQNDLNSPSLVDTWRNEKSPQPSNLDETANWKTYTNNVIRFTYPQAWEVYSKEKENFVAILDKDSNDVRFFLADNLPFKPSKQMTFEERAEAHKNYWAYSTSELGDASPKQMSKTKIAVDGNDGIKYVFRLENTGSKFRQAVWVYLPYDGEKFISIRSVGVDEEVINQILSTIKFLPTPPASGENGIKGKVVLGPTCPVAKQGKDECQVKPLQATVLVKTSDGIKELTRFTSDIQGNFEVILAPGNYLLEPVLKDNLPYGRPQTITVEKDKFTQITISYDTGLR